MTPRWAESSEVFAAAAAERGATALKAITGPGNEGSIEFHRKLGFEMTHVDDYGGTGRARLIMRRSLKDFPAPATEPRER